MGFIFKRERIRLILKGVKTQTQDDHYRLLKAGKIYDIKRDWVHKTSYKIRIPRVYR